MDNITVQDRNTDNIEYNIPGPSVAGNAQIKILSHSLINKKDREEGIGKGVVINLLNTAEGNIGKATFRALFYDTKGNILGTIEKDVIDLERNKQCILRIESDQSDIKSYDVKIVKVVITPMPIATGNKDISIIKHDLRKANTNGRGAVSTDINFAIRNISDKTLASIIFEAAFLDSEGNVIDIVKHREFELKPNSSRAVIISTTKDYSGIVKSYKVAVVKAITTDIEKVQLRRHEIRTTENGEEVRGLVKNISNTRADVALIATFKDAKEEKIGIKVLYLKGIEAGGLKRFYFVFTPPEGDSVKSYSLNIGDMIEEIDDINGSSLT